MTTETTKQMETKQTEETETKLCAVCGKEKPLAEMEKDSRRKPIYRNRCYKCKYRSEDAIRRKFRNLYNEAVSEDIDFDIFTPINLRKLVSHFGKCAYCGESDVVITFDHIVPTSEGGTHTLDNLLPACRSCNSSKGGRSLSDFYQRGGRNGMFDESKLSHIVSYLADVSEREEKEVYNELMAGGDAK